MLKDINNTMRVVLNNESTHLAIAIRLEEPLHKEWRKDRQCYLRTHDTIPVIWLSDWISEQVKMYLDRDELFYKAGPSGQPDSKSRQDTDAS